MATLRTLRVPTDPLRIPLLCLTQQLQNQGVQALLWLNVQNAVQRSKMLEMRGTSITLEAKHAISDSLVPAFGKLVAFY